MIIIHNHIAVNSTSTSFSTLFIEFTTTSDVIETVKALFSHIRAHSPHFLHLFASISARPPLILMALTKQESTAHFPHPVQRSWLKFNSTPIIGKMLFPISYLEVPVTFSEDNGTDSSDRLIKLIFRACI